MLYEKVEAIALSEVPSWMNPKISVLSFLDMVVPDLTLPLPAILEIDIDFTKPLEHLREFIENTQTRVSRHKANSKRAILKFPDTANSFEQAEIGSNFVIEGRLTQGKNSMYAIDGKDFCVSDQTWMFGNLNIGVKVKITGRVIGTGERYARKVTVMCN